MGTIKSYEEDCKDELYKFVDECKKLAEPIIERLLERAIKTMNATARDIVGFPEDYPEQFTFFDILTIELESKSYEEINPLGLREYVETTVLDEYRSLPALEKFVVDHSVLWPDTEERAVEKMILESFREKRFKHLDDTEIENYMLN